MRRQAPGAACLRKDTGASAGARVPVHDRASQGALSVVGSYRTQFNSILPSSSYESLLKRMRARIAQLKVVR
jgi:hypothetical protein